RVHDIHAARHDAEVRVLLVEERGVLLDDEPLRAIVDGGVRPAGDPNGTELEREVVVFGRHLFAARAGAERVTALHDPVLYAMEDLVVVEAASRLLDEARDGLWRLVGPERERERAPLGELDGRALRYGYPRIVTPVVEDRGVFTKSVGETSDIVGYEMYDVSLHGQGGLVLRPEGTAAVTRAFLEHGLHRAPRPVRFFYYEPMFRGQRPQLLRYRQFWQWGLECFGPEEPLADVEIVDFTVRLFSEVGLRNYELELNTVGDAKCQPKVKAALAEYFAKNRDALSDESKGR